MSPAASRTAVPTPVVPADVAARRRRTEPVPVRRRAGRAGGLVVACILDEFSQAAFSSEADLAPLTMENWLVELTAAQPDMLLVESAWRGHRQTWWNTVHRAGPELTGVVEWCRARGIPTAFWNKEDPVHFTTFLTAASRFDAVFTTDLDCVPAYKRELGHERVHFLPFAAQPVDANPVEAFDRVDGCAFAGAYYERYPERVADLHELARELSSDGRRFDIYDRNHGKDTPGYAFPDEYREHIVGGALTPDLLDIPYKGYTVNLNLNSVKQSQSMFARRVFELMASDTLVVSNFSRGLRLMFGDLVVSTDSGREMRRRLEALEAAPNGTARLRAMALRAVLREHTYAERLEFMARAAGVPLPDAAVERPLMVVFAGASGDAADLARRWTGQSWRDWRLAVVGGPVAGLPEDGRVLAVPEAADLRRVAAEHGCTSLGLLSARDWHGPHYLEDLLQALRWADVPACGHAEHLAVADGAAPETRRRGDAWTPVADLRLDRSLVRVDDWDALPWGLGPDGVSAAASGPGLAVSAVEYCAGGAGAPEGALEPVRALELDEGLGLAEIRAHADALAVEERQEDLPTLDLAEILEGMDAWDAFTLTWEPEGARLDSTKAAGRHQYWINPLVRPVPEDLRAGEEVHLDVGVGLDVMLVAFWLDDDGHRVGHTMIPVRRQKLLEVPEEAVAMQWGLRISGPGSAVIHRVVRGPYTAPPMPVLLRSADLVVSNIYPSYANLYRNGFVHSRLRGYLRRGVRTDAAVVHAGAGVLFREFEDVDVAALRPSDLAATLALGEVRTLSVHALLPPLWEVLRAAEHLPPTTVWIHGFEIQPWWRRRFNHTDDAGLEEEKRATDERLAMWREVFTRSPEDMHFVFVSRIFAETVFEDLGLRLPEDQYSIIHNPIDGSVFPYRRKAPEDRLRILSIRPYASRVYANDLAVAAVLELEGEPGFDELSFTFVGDGPLFDETVEPLRRLPNVEVRRGFLTHREIAEEHARHGVLLVPSRSDTQGVSRDEAMSSGLVPVTSAVASIPEFVDEDCAVLAPEEDHRELAAGIRRLQADPELFLRMSEAAASRVRRQSGAEHVLDAELDLALRRTARGRARVEGRDPAAPSEED